MFLCNDYAVAETVVPVSSGTELKSAIQNAKNPTIIEFVKKDNDIDISRLDKINLNTNAIEIDGKGYNLINEKDARFMFIDNSSLTIKNLNYVGKNFSINRSNKNATIVLENVAISGRTTSSVYEGPVLYMVNCNLTLNNVSVASSNVNIQGKNISGGVIYTKKDLIINANNGLTEFTGNYVSSDGGTTKRYKAIYVNATGKTLILNATAKGTILLNNYINGVNGYNVLLKGDFNSVIKLYQNADIKNGTNVSVDDNIVIDTADGKVQNFSEFNSFTSSASAKYNIDLDFSKTVDDTLNYSVGNIVDGFSTKGNSNGYITLDSLNFVDGSLNEILNKKYKIQIIKNNHNSDNLQLALSDKLTSVTSKISQIVNVERKDLTATANYKDIFGDITTTKDIYGILGLDKTNTTNDSISIKVTKIDVNVTATITDVLVALTKEEITGSDGSVLDKTFNLFDEDEFGNKTTVNYKASNNLGTTYKIFNIVGASNTDTSGKLILSWKWKKLC